MVPTRHTPAVFYGQQCPALRRLSRGEDPLLTILGRLPRLKRVTRPGSVILSLQENCCK